jgi:hypothetical protein
MNKLRDLHSKKEIKPRYTLQVSLNESFLVPQNRLETLRVNTQT